MLIEIFVDDKSYDTEDGYTLYSYKSKEIAQAVKLALDNGYEDIRISKAPIEQKLIYDKRERDKKEIN